jgi:hypothetical protein
MILKNCYLFQMFSYLSVTENDNFIFILSLTLICIGVNENFSLSLSVYLSVGLCRLGYDRLFYLITYMRFKKADFG